MYQNQIKDEPSPTSESDKDRRAPTDRYNLEEAFIYIDGERYDVKELLKLVVEKLKESKP
jgi:hypothetical protein